MNERLDLEARLSQFLVDEAPARAPERLVDATRRTVAGTRQNRRAGLLTGRLFGALLSPAGAFAAALLVVVFGAVLVAFNGSEPSIGSGQSAPAPSPATSPFPSPTASPYPCETGPGTCLGTLQPGTYNSQTFMPAVRYLVPDGWANAADSRTQFELAYSAGGRYRYPDGITFHDGIYIYRLPVAESMTSSEPQLGVGTTANDLARWLVGHENLIATAPTPVTIGQSSGYRMTLSVPPGADRAPDHCTTDHRVPTCVSLFISSDPAAMWGFGLVGPESAVVYLLDTPSGDTVLVVIDDVDGVDQPGLEAAGAPVVNSLVFSP